ncbi:MAG: hypothetical protein WC197_01100 [Candidatus Gastranaerophilaceae bacterium]|jgi:hypothetical protein
MTIKIKSITFYYPTTLTGGAQYLFVRLANHLVNMGIKVYHIDYSYGFSRRFLNESVEKINYVKNKKLNIDFDTTLIVAPCQIFHLYNQLNLSAKVNLFFWCLHPYNFVGLFPFFSKVQNSNKTKIKLFVEKYYKKEYVLLKKIINELYDKKSLIFMDPATYDCNKYLFDIKSDEKYYLPIPLMVVDFIPNSHIIDENCINIGYLGNLVDFKISSILNLIQNADLYSEKYNKKFKIHIIGRRDEQHILDEYKIKNNVEIIYKGILLEDELNNYLLNTIDILFAMGTSCLEGAKLNIPSVVLDYSYNEFPMNYKFKWLFESKDYSLGDFVSDVKENKHNFEDIINSIYIDKQKKTIGEKCHNYFQTNHSINAVGDKLLEYLNEKSEINMNFFKNSGLYKTKIQYFELIWKGLSIIKTFLRLNKN